MKAHTDNINVNDRLDHVSEAVGPASANERCEPYAMEPARPQLGENDNAPSTERFERRGTVRAEVHQIIREISAATGSDVTVADVMGRSRFQYIVDVRHLAMVEVSKRFPWMSYPQMGRLFGGRDHSTIMHALRKFGALQKRMHGGGGGGVGVSARTYGPLVDFLFVRIGAALSASPATTEGASHELA
jgi:hypothetical protein